MGVARRSAVGRLVQLVLRCPTLHQEHELAGPRVNGCVGAKELRISQCDLVVDHDVEGHAGKHGLRGFNNGDPGAGYSHEGVPGPRPETGVPRSCERVPHGKDYVPVRLDCFNRALLCRLECSQAFQSLRHCCQPHGCGCTLLLQILSGRVNFLQLPMLIFSLLLFGLQRRLHLAELCCFVTGTIVGVSIDRVPLLAQQLQLGLCDGHLASQ
mmetsp:Transcript_9784/g.27688  ORF Transcript_9784/g.27688 Transcript_9784/m.27688 type:complete len:212 (-) Transcript_9784:248-883(-)